MYKIGDVVLVNTNGELYSVDGKETRIKNIDDGIYKYFTSSGYWLKPEWIVKKVDTSPLKKAIHLTVDLFNSISSYGIKIPDYYVDRFGYKIDVVSNMSSKSDIYVKIDLDGNIVASDTIDGTFNKTIKLGRLLRALNRLVQDHDIESAVSQHKENYTIDTSTVKVSEDIDEVYDISPVGGSCMANKGEYMQVYKDVDCTIAYITKVSPSTGNTFLGARAILWDNNIVGVNTKTGERVDMKVMDRIFFTKENNKLTLLKWAKENGFVYRDDIPDNIYLETKKSIDSSYEYVPYIDTLYYVTNEYKLTDVEDNGYIDTFRETDGSSTDRHICSNYGDDNVYCEDTGEYVHIDDAYYCETDGYYYEGTDYLLYVDGEGYYHEDDDGICCLEDTGNYGFVSNSYYCETDRCYYEYIDDLVMIGDEYYHREDDNICYVQDNDEYDFKDNVWQWKSGLWFSYEEEEEDYHGEEEDDEDVA